MRAISPSVKQQLLEEPDICSFLDENCDGRITWEHAVQFASKQMDKAWAIVKICEYHHSLGKYHNSGGGLIKEKTYWVALNRATDEELLELMPDPIPKRDFFKDRERLNKKYGEYQMPM